MAPVKERRPPCDRFTDASATAISSGFAAVMALGPQPAGPKQTMTSRPRSSTLGSSTGPIDQAALQFPSICDITGLSPGDGDKGLRPASLMDEGEGEEDSDLDEEDVQNGQGDGKPNGHKRGAGGRKNDKKRRSTAEASADDRKAQNRIAQREFRQRKQQYIRALEARVELLSSDHDTQVDRLRWALRGLLNENNLLRSMLGNLAGFIGNDMLGGPLQKAGMDRDALEDLINTRSEKTMTERWQHWPGAKESEALRQLRLDAKLPPEGLPESSRLPKARPQDNSEASVPQIDASSKKRKASNDSAQGSSSDNAPPPQADASTSLFGMETRLVASPRGSNRTSTSTLAMPNAGDAGASALPSNPAQSTFHFSPRDFGLGGYSAASSSGTGSALSPFNIGDTEALLAGLFGEGAMSSTSAPGRPISSHTSTSQSLIPSLATSNGIGESHDHFGSATHGETASSVGASAIPGSSDRSRNLDCRFPSEKWQYLIHRINAQRERMGRTDFIATLPGGDTETFARLSPQQRAKLDSAPLVPPGRLRSPQEMMDLSEAVVQMIYHFDNAQRNRNYTLPEILKTSAIQTRIPHDTILDGIPMPGIRDNLILRQHEYNVEEVIVCLIEYSHLHGEDAMRNASWEVELPFMVRYPELVDELTLINANKWRATRGESPIDPSSLMSWTTRSPNVNGRGTVP